MPHSLESDLITSKLIVSRVRTSDVYAQNLYAALCNNVFQRNDVLPRLRDETWSCSWRHAGAIVAQIKGHGDYMDYYCSGMAEAEDAQPDQRCREFLSEGKVANSIRQDLFALGWIVVDS